MLLATTQVEDFDRFLEIFSTKGAEKRKQHGSKGALVFRDPSEDDRVWVIFDWDEQGWQSFVSDPEVPPIMKEAGHKAQAAGRAASPASATPETNVRAPRTRRCAGPDPFRDSDDVAQAPVPVRSSHLTAVLAGREQREDRDTAAVHPHLRVAYLAERA